MARSTVSHFVGGLCHEAFAQEARILVQVQRQGFLDACDQLLLGCWRGALASIMSVRHARLIQASLHGCLLDQLTCDS